MYVEEDSESDGNSHQISAKQGTFTSFVYTFGYDVIKKYGDDIYLTNFGEDGF